MLAQEEQKNKEIGIVDAFPVGEPEVFTKNKKRTPQGCPLFGGVENEFEQCICNSPVGCCWLGRAPATPQFHIFPTSLFFGKIFAQYENIWYN